MKPGDLVRFREYGFEYPPELYVVVECEPPPHDRNDKYKVRRVSQLGWGGEWVYEREVEVIS